jgi:hypothetical protein
MPDVFLSYAKEDLVIASQVALQLRDEGFVVFWDREIPIGKTWESHIEKALLAAQCVVVLWSSNSIESDWVRAEAAAAVDRGVLMPVNIDITLPPLRFRTMQSADLASWNGRRDHPELVKLVAAVRMLAKIVKRPQLEEKQARQARYAENTLATAEIETGINRGRSIILTASMTSVTIGRSRDCDFVLDSSYVSRSHCRLEVKAAENSAMNVGRYSFVVIDSGSVAGTLVNGERVERATLRNGDRFQIGEVRFLFRVMDEGTA